MHRSLTASARLLISLAVLGIENGQSRWPETVDSMTLRQFCRPIRQNVSCDRTSSRFERRSISARVRTTVPSTPDAIWPDWHRWIFANSPTNTQSLRSAKSVCDCSIYCLLCYKNNLQSFSTWHYFHANFPSTYSAEHPYLSVRWSMGKFSVETISRSQ